MYLLGPIIRTNRRLKISGEVQKTRCYHSYVIRLPFTKKGGLKVANLISLLTLIKFVIFLLNL